MYLISTRKKQKDAISYEVSVTKGDKFYKHLPNGSALDLVIIQTCVGAGSRFDPYMTFAPRECLNPYQYVRPKEVKQCAEREIPSTQMLPMR